jgi:hypothetical protein
VSDRVSIDTGVGVSGCRDSVGVVSRSGVEVSSRCRARAQLLARLGMSEYYSSEGFDHPPSDVYSYGGGYFGDDGAGA